MISVITCTNKDKHLSNILGNYKRQLWEEKELIIVLNKNSINLSDWKRQLLGEPSVKVFQIDEAVSLGECLNIAIKNASYDYIAKFDDDDYYTEDYLTHSFETIKSSKAKVVGKTTIYMYFEEDQTLREFNPYKFAPEPNKLSENYYNPKILMGGTLLFEKKVNRIVPFQDCSTGEDAKFCEDCIEHGITIFSGTKDHYVYIRHSTEAHTWKMKNQKLKKFCTPIIETMDFISYLKNIEK